MEELIAKHGMITMKKLESLCEYSPLLLIAVSDAMHKAGDTYEGYLLCDFYNFLLKVQGKF